MPESQSPTPSNGETKLRGAERADGWFSSLSGFGITGKDKRQSVLHSARDLSRPEIEDLWRGNDLAARIIETIPNEALRRGFEINAGDKELSEDISGFLEEQELTPTLLKAKQYERAWGGSAIYPVINDGSADLAHPLDLTRIPEISHFLVLEPRELTPVTYYDRLTDRRYGEPSIYRLNPIVKSGMSISTLIHESRLVVFPGIRVSRTQISSSNWGDSVLNRSHDVLRDFGIAWASAAMLLHDFSQASFKIKGLAKLMASDKDDVIKTRIRAVELSRSTINAVMMDSEEEWERKQTPVSGLPELLDRFATRVAAAADMPVTLLMGQSPAGLNATGESDIRFFYDRVGVYQTLGVKPQLEQLIKLFLLSKVGPTKGNEPDNWSVTFRPLWQQSDQEVATTRKTVAETDRSNIEMGIVSPREIAMSRYGGDTYSMETVVDFEERDTLDTDSGDDTLGNDEEIGVSNSAPEVPGAAVENVAATAMNGAQVTSLLEVVMAVGMKTLSRASAIGILKVAFRMSEEEATEVLGPVDFVPVNPEAVAEEKLANGQARREEDRKSRKNPVVVVEEPEPVVELPSVEDEEA